MSLFGTPRWVILNTTAASAADLVVAEEVAYLQKNYIGRYLDYQQLTSVKETAITSETAGIITITPSVASTNNQVYSFTLNQQNPSATGVTPSLVTKVISITTPVSGTVTATTICDQFRAEFFNAGQTSFAVVASGTATLVITASAGSPVIWATYVNTGTGGLQSGDVVNGTAGVQTRGTVAALTALGAPSASLTGAAYTLYTIRNNEGGQNGVEWTHVPELIYIALLESMTNYAALITRMDEYFNSFASGGTAVDPKLAEII